MQAGLSTKNAPSPKVVLPHYAYGALAFLAAAVMMFFAGSDWASTYMTPKVLSIAHVMILGWITMIIFGALYQLIPVVMEVKLFSEKLAMASFISLGIGTPMIAFGFWFNFIGASHAMMTGGALVIISVLMFVVNVFGSAAKTKNKTIENRFIVASVVWLLLTVLLGLSIVLYHAILTKGAFLIHIHLGIVGWFMMLVVGVASTLMPMFFISHQLNKKYLEIAFWLIQAGLLMLITTMFLDLGNYVRIFSGATILLGFVFFKRKSGDDQSDSGGFLDSISNEGANNNEYDDFNSPLDSSSTELDLTNLDDVDDLADEKSSAVQQSGEDSLETDSEDEPDVVVMDDSSEDLEELDLDLEFGLDDDTQEDLNLDSDSGLEQADDDELENLEMEFDLEEEVSEQQEESDSDDLSLDFKLDDLDLDIESEQEFDLDLDLSNSDLDKVTEDAEELDDLVFDTGERTIVDAVESIGGKLEEATKEESDDLEFDLSDDLFNDEELESVAENDDVTELNLETLDEDDLDLSIDDGDDLEFSLETGESDEVVETDEASEIDPDPIQEESYDDETIDIGLDFDDLASDDAIDTKIDLAKAYFEMGDIDGAQQMVNEIIEEGNDEQKSKAEALKSEIEGS